MGVMQAESTKYQLKLNSDDYDISQVIKHLFNSGEPNTAILIWHWKYSIKKATSNNFLIPELLQLFSLYGFSNIGANMLVLLLKQLSPNDKKILSNYLLSLDDYWKLPNQTLSAALNALADEKELILIKTKEILRVDNLLILPSGIISTSLNLLVKYGEGKKQALDILSHSDFDKFPFDIISRCLNILAEDPAGIDMAKRILSKEKFWLLPYQIISVALKIISKDKVAEDKARVILAQDNFWELPYQIVSASLYILSTSDDGKIASEKIIEQSLKTYIHPYISSPAMRITATSERTQKYAREILKKGLVEMPTLIFQALNTLAISTDKQDNALVQQNLKTLSELVVKRKVNDTQLKLYYDILSIPLWAFPIHNERVNRILKGYKFQ